MPVVFPTITQLPKLVLTHQFPLFQMLYLQRLVFILGFEFQTLLNSSATHLLYSEVDTEATGGVTQATFDALDTNDDNKLTLNEILVGSELTPGSMGEVWVQFGSSPVTETGLNANPFDTLYEAMAMVDTTGASSIKFKTANDTPETITIGEGGFGGTLTLLANNGTVQIGVSGQSLLKEFIPQSGFVSRRTTSSITP